MSRVLFSRITETQWEQHTKATVSYADLKASIDDYYEDNIAHRDQTDKLVEATMSSLDKSSTTINYLYNGLNVIIELLKDINNAVKDEPTANKKINERSLQISLSVTLTLALTRIPANVEGENDTNTTTEDPPSHTEGEIDANKQEKPHQPSITQATPITTINPEPFVLEREGKGIAIDEQLCYLTNEQLEAHIKKEERIKKAEEEAKLYAINKPEVIKVVCEEAKKLGIHPKEAITTKAGEVLRKLRMLNMQPSINNTLRKLENLLSSESTIYRGTDGRNFNVRIPFAFGDFGISELDELREIIPKKKNAVFALPAPVPVHAPEQASSQSSRKKRKHIELEPETRIHGLECNQSLPENVPFVNNMVIKEPKYGILFTDEFGDQAFQRWSDIDKVGMEALVSYLVAASMVKSPENASYLTGQVLQQSPFYTILPAYIIIDSMSNAVHLKSLEVDCMGTTLPTKQLQYENPRSDYIANGT
ncbi:hypothetical protein Tco_1456946 [Tanacetum coccineum]